MSQDPKNSRLPVYIYGAGMLGRQVYLLLTQSLNLEFELMGVIDDVVQHSEVAPWATPFLGGMKSVLHSFSGGGDMPGVVMAIGYSDLSARWRAYEQCKKAGFSFPNLIHPRAYVDPSVKMGEGNVILPGAVVDTDVVIANLNFIDLGSLIGHNSTIGSNNFFTIGCSVAGRVKIGDNNFIGMKSGICDGINVGDDNFIAAHSIITRPLRNRSRHFSLFENRVLNDVDYTPLSSVDNSPFEWEKSK